MAQVKLYDTTLRDGSQTEGISFTVGDKLRIAEKLDVLGVHYIEGGWPGSNPKDMEFFKQIQHLRIKKAKLTAFGSTRRCDTKTSTDPNIAALLKAGTKTVTIFGKSWDLHVHEVLKTSLDENCRMIYESIKYLKAKGKEVFFDAEHFFDGYKNNPQYALKTIIAACDAGADTLIFCDTNGGTITSEITKITRIVKGQISTPLGIHTHNDSGMAVANTIAAVEEGCTHVQGTINGYGERCGNADLCAIIATLFFKLNIRCVSNKQIKELTEISRYVSEVSNMKQLDNQPYVGNSAFAHKGGVHINAVVKNPKSYEHISPEEVGNHRRLLVSELSGKTSILVKAKGIDLDLGKADLRTKKIHKLLQNLEHQGYQFEAAEGSFELLLNKALKQYRKFFELKGFRVIIEKRDNKVVSEATIKIKVGNIEEHTAAEGEGPVNALDNALRKALVDFYPTLSAMHLSDFKVRVLDSKDGTAAKVRVLIESQDEKGSWWTVGVSENIIEASYQALVDSIEYKLLKEKIL
ncbi:MAG: citramalate synthase [Candidatus Omnitrophota bacterium]